MATPHVAGVVALMAAAAPGLTPAQAMANLKTSGECPDGSIAGADASCAGQGTWPDDPDGIPEPMIHALRAAVASGNPPPPTAPGAPNLTAASAGNASVALTWTAPASDGGSPISGYQIWRGTTSGGESLLTTVGVTTSYTDSTRQQRHDLLLPGRRGQRRRHRSGLQRAQRHAGATTAAHRPGCSEPDRRHAPATPAWR